MKDKVLKNGVPRCFTQKRKIAGMSAVPVLMVFFLFCQVSCSTKPQPIERRAEEPGELKYAYRQYYNDENQNRAWKAQDTSYFREFLSFLEITTRLPDSQFFDEIGGLCAKSGFYFGLYDVSESDWQRLTLEQQIQEKKNAIYAQRLRLKSPLVFDSVPDDKAYYFQGWHNGRFGTSTNINMADKGDAYWLSIIDSLYK